MTAKTTVNYLGCKLDSVMSGEEMATQVLEKVHKKTKFLARKSKYLDISTLKTLAVALVQSNFDYACTSWYSNISKRLKNRLQTAQNKLIRVVLKLPPRTHLDSQHFKSLGWLTVEDRVTMLKLRLVHGIFLDSAPSYFRGYFKRVSDSHNHRTRASDANVNVFRFRTVVGKSTFAYTGAIAWNSLPASLKSIVSKNLFKVAVKKWLMANQEG